MKNIFIALVAVVLSLIHTAASAFWVASGSSGHYEITNQALQHDRLMANLSTGEKIRFQPKGIFVIALENVSVDLFYDGKGYARYHFDDEKFIDSFKLLVDSKQEILRLLRPIEPGEEPNAELARARLGMLLHTLQDYYSHSTHVDMGFKKIQAALGDDVYVPGLSLKSSEIGDVCEITSKVSVIPPFEIIYDTVLIDSSNITTGYYPFPDACDALSRDVPGGKCIHGPLHNLTGRNCAGINKDHWGKGSLHSEAYRLAKEATIYFIETQIIDVLEEEKNDDALCRLMGAFNEGSFATGDSFSVYQSKWDSCAVWAP